MILAVFIHFELKYGINFDFNLEIVIWKKSHLYVSLLLVYIKETIEIYIFFTTQVLS